MGIPLNLGMCYELLDRLTSNFISVCTQNRRPRAFYSLRTRACHVIHKIISWSCDSSVTLFHGVTSNFETKRCSLTKRVTQIQSERRRANDFLESLYSGTQLM